MEILSLFRPGFENPKHWQAPMLSHKINYGYLWPAQTRYGISQKQKRNTCGAQTYLVCPGYYLPQPKISLVYLEALIYSREIMLLSFAICSNTKTYHLGQDSSWLLLFLPVSVQDVLGDEVTTTCTHVQHKQTVAGMTNKNFIPFEKQDSPDPQHSYVVWNVCRHNNVMQNPFQAESKPFKTNCRPPYGNVKGWQFKSSAGSSVGRMYIHIFVAIQRTLWLRGSFI